MTEFWETNFNQKHEIWGLSPCKSAIITKDFFVNNNFKNILIPGIGYGRNAQPFIAHGMKVTGIEISKTALKLSKKNYGNSITLYHGSVTQMPFDNLKYDGIFCHALIHLLKPKERIKLIKDCYNQLTENGVMIFTAISKEAPNYGKGTLVSKDCYEFHKGVAVYYYDEASIIAEFKNFGDFEISKVQEDQPMYFIKCSKHH